MPYMSWYLPLQNLPSFGPKDVLTRPWGQRWCVLGWHEWLACRRSMFIHFGRLLGMWKAMGDMRNRARPCGSKLQSASSSACLPAVSCCLHNASVVST